jgi:hypothetical protein
LEVSNIYACTTNKGKMKNMVTLLINEIVRGIWYEGYAR